LRRKGNNRRVETKPRIIPGFGPDISAKVLEAIGNPHRFENHRQVLKFAGLDLSADRSGKKQDVTPVISKKGKADLRYCLYQAALIASTRNTQFMTYFTGKLKGRDREKGIGTKKPHYVLGLKGNQSTLHEEVEFFFQDCLASKFKNVAHDYHETIDGDHGRIETRRYWSACADWLPEREEWKNLSAIVMAQRECYQNGQTSLEFRYYITSMESNAKKIAEAVRGHWGIENSLHWVLDIAFREDECRIRKDHAPANFAVLRHIALNLLRKETSKRRSIKTKRLRAGWDTDYLGKILRGSVQ
jgi:predicted transposase YbfD/YdcC